MNTDNHNCHMSVYAICQEGATLIKSMDIDLDKSKFHLTLKNFKKFDINIHLLLLLDSMICRPPKSHFTKMLEEAKLRFRIESDAVVFLLILLIINVLLFLLLVPCLVSQYCTQSLTNLSP